MIVRERMLQYVMCKLKCLCTYNFYCLNCYIYYSNHCDQIYAGSNSYRELFFEAMNDITDLK